MKIDKVIEIMKQLRDRQGNSSDDIEAFNIAITALEIINVVNNAYTWTDGSKGDKESENNENN